MSNRKITPLTFQAVLSVLTLLLGLVAMTFTPYKAIYTDGVWHTQFNLDPLHLVRRSVMIFGVVACVLSPCFLLGELVRNKWRGSDIILHLSMILLCFTIGWSAYPYWVNGVFQAYLGFAPRADFDPRAIVPETWLGGSWYAGAFLLPYCCLLAIPALLLLALVFSVEDKSWRKGTLSAICLALVVAFYFLSPEYLNWLGD